MASHSPSRRLASAIAIGLLLLLAVLARTFLASSTAYVWDEDRDWIHVAESISFEPDRLHLPVRAIAHPALPAYLIKASGALFGRTPLGFRLASVLAGTITVLVIYAAAKSSFGNRGALWTAALFAFNEYHICISSLAVQKSFYLMFATISIACYLRFVRSRSPRMLHAAALSLGLAFLCYEIAALVVVAILLDMLLSERRALLRTAAPYLALALFLIVISPDLYWNLARGATSGGEYGYTDHLSRFGGVAVSLEPLTFFLRALVRRVVAAFGGEFVDPMPEYRAMNPLIGSILLGSVALTTLAAIRSRRSRFSTTMPLLLTFWCVFLFFVFLKTSSAPGSDADRVSWIWCDLALVPAALIFGHTMATLGAGKRRAMAIAAVAGIAIASFDLIASRLHLPAVTAFCSPEYLPVNQDAKTRVSIQTQSAMLCGQPTGVTVASVRSEEGGRFANAVAGDDYEIASDGSWLAVRLRSDSLAFGQRRTYQVHVRLTDGRGHEHRAVAIARAESAPDWWRPPFWAVD